jgi:hypothetical protein
MGIYQHKDTGVACEFVGYTTDGFVGLRIGLHNHCISKDKFETYYIKFEPKCGDLLESENFVVKFYHFLGDDYENFLGELVECKSGGKIEGINTFTTEFFRTMSRETSAIITEKLDKINNLDQKEDYDFVNPEHYKRGNMEVIDMMKLLWGTEALILHCEMTSFKYRMRAGTKPDQPIERELEKARWYDEKAKKLRYELR